MNMRKTLALIMAVFFMAGATAFAAGDVCQGCKAPLAYIPNPTGQQECRPFDFDGDPGVFPDPTNIIAYPNPLYNIEGTTGYCEKLPNYSFNNGAATGQLKRDLQRNPKLIFTICNCTTATSFTPGRWIGVQMKILTKGVYWTTPNDPPVAQSTYTFPNAQIFQNNNPSTAAGQTSIKFGRYASLSTGADPTKVACKSDDYVTNPSTPYAALLGSETAATVPWATITPNSMRDLGPANYYSETMQIAGPSNGTPIGNCAITNDNQRAKIVRTVQRTTNAITNIGYQIRPEDNGLVYWWIDVPQMMVNKSEVVAGDKVSIEVQLFDNSTGGTTICTTCPPLCSCTYDIGIIGCQDSAVVAAGSCIYFPYIFTGDKSWWTGLAISKLASGDSTLSFEITDGAGTVCKASYTMKEKMYVKVVDEMLTSLSWDKKPAAGAALIKISATTPIDGFQFMSNNSISAAVLARQACGF